ncbi:DUF4399 domain-containing protein [Pelomonas sp. SE-A7]|uniref:DUF4399 domain-containing protein n=1 Tax=Pelomonas sp. SE-A7 TaxID=3054953 RepID=UPI00259C7F5B|nr:DUF4399 domain-containing protein [Pelomonas sp. SE-A7]MDM4766136.1 DUF4399 domain-containing protein [Pelomonas sp. SE-A7]
MGHRILCSLVVLALASVSPAGRADTLPAGALEKRCWLAHTSERTAVDLREPTAVSFSNLRNGYAFRSPFWVEFGVRGMGVVPAGNKNERAGHHHILIDTPLPINHQAQIPFSDTHKHFGKGQTGTQLDLPDGKHTLRLLFADHEHRPYFVYSREISIQVIGRRTAAPVRIESNNFDDSCTLWYQDTMAAPRSGAKEAYVKNLRDEEVVGSPFTLSFGVVGLGIAPAAQKVKDTGHFIYTINSRGGGQVQRQVLADGRTESLIELPRGDYELDLRLQDSDGNQLLKAPPLRFSVQKQER